MAGSLYGGPPAGITEGPVAFRPITRRALPGPYRVCPDQALTWGPQAWSSLGMHRIGIFVIRPDTGFAGSGHRISGRIPDFLASSFFENEMEKWGQDQFMAPTYYKKVQVGMYIHL